METITASNTTTKGKITEKYVMHWSKVKIVAGLAFLLMAALGMR